MRLNAFLARAGVASRRGADELIKVGRVTVNGRTAKLNDQVDDSAAVMIDNKPIAAQKLHYILLYKPAGYVTTLNDPEGRPKILDLLSISERVVPVGRLDYDTTGALLLTNDGELANQLMHPSFEVDKIYEAQTQERVTPEMIKQLTAGVKLEDGRLTKGKAEKLGRSKISLIIHEGRKHQVKRMLAAVGLTVKSLHRPQYGSLTLDGLKSGQWRELTSSEVKSLKS